MASNTKIAGRFYFKQTTNGNLIGEFSNDHAEEVSTESADLTGARGDFVGRYLSTWQEGGQPLFANLSITQKFPANNKLFTLIWSRNGNPIFQGEGMLCDEILFGDYHSTH